MPTNCAFLNVEPMLARPRSFELEPELGVGDRLYAFRGLAFRVERLGARHRLLGRLMAELRADGLRRRRAGSRILLGLACRRLQLRNLVAAGARVGRCDGEAKGD